MQNLLKWLDEKSKKIIEKIISRYIYIYHNNILDVNKVLDNINENTIKKYLKNKKEVLKKYSLLNWFYSESVFYFKNWLVFIPKNILKKYKWKSIIDGGAFIWDSAIVFNNELNPSNIFLFEPDTKNYNLMLEVIKKNNLTNCFPVKKWIWDIKWRVNFISQWWWSKIWKWTDYIEITTIDNFIEENKINDLWVIKLDIEWYELEAIKWAINTIKRFKPILLISIYHSAKDFFEIKPLIEKLNLGYIFKIRKLTFISPTIDTILIAYPEK